MTTELLFLPLGVVAGALTQRVTGIGFALVSAPLLVLIAGPFEGVVLSNLLGLTVSVVVFVAHWRHTEWKKGLLLAVPALIAIPLGAYVARNVPPAPLMVIIGLLVILALGAVLLSERARVLRGPGGATVAGATSGFMNVTAGVGGPAIVLYAVSTGWEHRKFVATFQFYSIFTNLASLAAKGGLPPRHPGRPGRLVRRAGRRVGRRRDPLAARRPRCGPPSGHRPRAGRSGLHRRQGRPRLVTFAEQTGR
ncbi:MAG: sulfite exporter TauE/SafE family protein [Lapillicoccus sp.]